MGNLKGDDDAVISIRIASEDDVFSPFDPAGMTLSDDIKSYMMDKLSAHRSFRRVKVNFICDTEVDEGRIRSVLIQSVDDSIKKLEKEKHLNIYSQLRLVIFGLSFISLWLALSVYLEQIWAEVLSIIGSFSIWEASNILIIVNPELKYRRLMLESLKKADISFTYASEE